MNFFNNYMRFFMYINRTIAKLLFIYNLYNAIIRKIYLALISIININPLVMAVPKRKTSRSKRNMRRSHDKIEELNIILDKNSGEPRLQHRIDLSTGMYNGKTTLVKKEKPDNTK